MNGFDIFDLKLTLRLTSGLLGFAMLVQAGELWSWRRRMGRGGPWSWQLIEPACGPSPNSIVRLAFEQGATLTILMQSIAAAAIIAIGAPWALAILFCSQIFWVLRFQGLANGGSDGMAMVLILGLSVAAVFPSWAPQGLLYIAVQSFLSYVLAGAVKFANPDWRSGRAIAFYLNETLYDVPSVVRKLAVPTRLARALAWGLMLFELSALSWFIEPRILFWWLPLAFAFHLLNFALFGLNRFVFVWLATYPAVLYGARAWAAAP